MHVKNIHVPLTANLSSVEVTSLAYFLFECQFYLLAPYAKISYGAT